MMKIGKLLMVACLASLFCACSKDDARDDTQLDMSYLTGKDWYYNAWVGDKNGFGGQDLLEVIRMENGGALKNIDFSGRREYTVGTWTSNENKITFHYHDGNEVIWHVQHSGENYIQAVINEQGSREYTSSLGYLGDLTADAFLVNEYTAGNQLKTYVGVDVRGNLDVREGKLLMADGNQVNLKNNDYFWIEEMPLYVDPETGKKEVRFYIRVGKDIHLKLRDSLYRENLPGRLPAETNLNINDNSGDMLVSWTPYALPKVYYRIEVLDKYMDLRTPYFVSRIQNPGTASLIVKSTTAGEVNRLNELKKGETYVVRLTALLYEPGIDPVNDNYGYANVQAVAYFTKKYLKE